MLKRSHLHLRFLVFLYLQGFLAFDLPAETQELEAEVIAWEQKLLPKRPSLKPKISLPVWKDIKNDKFDDSLTTLIAELVQSPEAFLKETPKKELVHILEMNLKSNEKYQSTLSKTGVCALFQTDRFKIFDLLSFNRALSLNAVLKKDAKQINNLISKFVEQIHCSTNLLQTSIAVLSTKLILELAEALKLELKRSEINYIDITTYPLKRTIIWEHGLKRQLLEDQVIELRTKLSNTLKSSNFKAIQFKNGVLDRKVILKRLQKLKIQDLYDMDLLRDQFRQSLKFQFALINSFKTERVGELSKKIENYQQREREKSDKTLKNLKQHFQEDMSPDEIFLKSLELSNDGKLKRLMTQGRLSLFFALHESEIILETLKDLDWISKFYRKLK